MRLPNKDLDVKNDLDKKYLAGIKNSTLFYPCAGADLLVPIRLFSPFITDFWFVDCGYFRPGHQNTDDNELDVRADKLPSVLSGDKSYSLLGKCIDGEPSWHRNGVDDIPPCVLTQVYRHIPSNRCIRIHLCRDDALLALRKEIRSLGVFFYRGDSEGEGGSGHYWLGSKQLAEILPMLVDGGLIVTDGAQGDPPDGQQYHELVRFHRKSPKELGIDPVAMARPFRDEAGRRFQCISQAGQGNGPTLIWCVTRAPVKN